MKSRQTHLATRQALATLRASSQKGSSRSMSSSARLLSTSSITSPHHTRPAALGFSSFILKENDFNSNYNRSYATSAGGALRKTPLHDLHLSHGAKMVPFGGFDMPVQYSGLSVSDSHAFTRSHASLFDVSHMVQRHFSGPDAAAFLETVTPSNLRDLPVHRSTLSTLLWKTGGICDDTVITRLGENLYYVVTNAGCREKDDDYFAAELAAFGSAKHVKHEELQNWGLVALQGPLSKDILTDVLADHEEADLPNLLFGSSIMARVRLAGDGELSSPLLISRAGYTGEDGFEISIPPEETVAVTETLLSKGTAERVQFAGLGARDSLRLEAGMCLYGHDLSDATTPVEAGLSWVIPKERRASGGFHGADVILKQIVPKTKGGLGVEQRRIGLIVAGAPAREGAEIVDKEGNVVGHVTSGCPSPTLGKNIAMGYVKDGLHKSGTELGVLVRGRKRDATVTKMPFVPTKYWKGMAPA